MCVCKEKEGVREGERGLLKRINIYDNKEMGQNILNGQI